jgi:hypothetical protein
MERHLGGHTNSQTYWPHYHYSRTCWRPEEVIDRKERKNLARVYVRLKSGSDLFQASNGQALCYAKIVLVGMTAHTAGGRPKVRLLALFVAAMGASRARQAQ